MATLDNFIVKGVVEICRDKKDNFLLSLVQEGNTTYLLSGDKDLLEIVEFKGVKICKILDYLTL